MTDAIYAVRLRKISLIFFSIVPFSVQSLTGCLELELAGGSVSFLVGMKSLDGIGPKAVEIRLQPLFGKKILQRLCIAYGERNINFHEDLSKYPANVIGIMREDVVHRVTLFEGVRDSPTNRNLCNTWGFNTNILTNGHCS